MSSCEDFLEVEPPDHQIVSEVVFSNDETAISVMQGIYNQLFMASFSAGWQDSITVLAGLSSDELACIRTSNLTLMEFDQHEIQPDNPRNLNVWSSAYNIIYMTNSLLEGLGNSESVTAEVRDRLEGQARFVRAFTYFYLVNLYGEVPMVLTTDYRTNALQERNTREEIYEQMIADLRTAMNLLGGTYLQGERTYANHFTAMAMLARVHLFRENWQEAIDYSTRIINESGTYELSQDLDAVFLANSREAIWQISPVGGGTVTTHTNEGSVFIINPVFAFFSHLKLSNDFIGSFKEDDKRLMQWTNFHEGLSVHYPYKYKIRYSEEEVLEYSMVLRLAEQYLIRAEARAMQGDLAGAISDLDIIRTRAGLEPVSTTNPSIGKEALLQLILEEREHELFSEWGHRWLDLKRTGEAGEVLGTNDPLWEETDLFYPIPEEERMANPNLDQNPGD